jgi:hypothetical protein
MPALIIDEPGPERMSRRNVPESVLYRSMANYRARNFDEAKNLSETYGEIVPGTSNEAPPNEELKNIINTGQSNRYFQTVEPDTTHSIENLDRQETKLAILPMRYLRIPMLRPNYNGSPTNPVQDLYEVELRRRMQEYLSNQISQTSQQNNQLVLSPIRPIRQVLIRFSEPNIIARSTSQLPTSQSTPAHTPSQKN